MEEDTGRGRNARYYAMLHYAMVYMVLYTMYTRQMRYSKYVQCTNTARSA